MPSNKKGRMKRPAEIHLLISLNAKKVCIRKTINTKNCWPQTRFQKTSLSLATSTLQNRKKIVQELNRKTQFVVLWTSLPRKRWNPLTSKSKIRSCVYFGVSWISIFFEFSTNLKSQCSLTCAWGDLVLSQDNKNLREAWPTFFAFYLTQIFLRCALVSNKKLFVKFPATNSK